MMDVTRAHRPGNPHEAAAPPAGAPSADSIQRRLAVGAEVLPGGGVHFRVWAPRRQCVEVVLEDRLAHDESLKPLAIALAEEGNGYFSGIITQASDGARYRYRLDGGESFPDPAARRQPEGPHGPSQVVDPNSFEWTDAAWRGLRLEGQVLYEMHVGTFTKDGTWRAAAAELEELKEFGISCVELMPVAEFPGAFGWGYDGVGLYAPSHLYGAPDDFRRFVDRAHALGLGVVLDVVYNHIGPDGAYHRQFSEDYYHSVRGKTDWGEALNFDGAICGPVREFFVANAGYWVDEFHLDGLRLDATHVIFDHSDEHLLRALARHARAQAGHRSILLITEDDAQDAKQIRPTEEGGYGLDAHWNDDFHHAAVVALTGRAEAYYGDYQGTPQELISSIKWGFLFQGQYCAWQKKPRGAPTYGLKAQAFVTYLESHDQVANSARGARLRALTSPGRYRAMTALWLLAPGTPMFFQGQEFGATTPFLFFADHTEELAVLVQRGRFESLARFESIAHADALRHLAAPGDSATFLASKLEFNERIAHALLYTMHKDLLKLRRDDPVFRAQESDRIAGAVLGPEALVLRYFGDDDDGRLVLLNLGRDLFPGPTSEPLLAPPPGMQWQVLWYSEHPRYGGSGIPPLETAAHWRIPGHAAIVLHPVKQ
jgi:maltooligosyltrehalose trehalohydrolase